MLEEYCREKFAVDENRVTVGIKFDPQTSEHILYISRVPDLADHFQYISLVIGDSLQNLRSTLDHLTWQLALFNTNGTIRRPTRAKFPFVDSCNDWKSAVGDALAEIHPDHRAIIQRFQPYKGIDGKLLGLLNVLANEDKHRLVIPILIRPANIDKGIGIAQHLLDTGKFGSAFGVALMANPVVLGAEVIRAKVSKRVFEADVEMYATFSPTIAFEPDRPVLDTLDYCASAVIRVVREFEPIEQQVPSPAILGRGVASHDSAPQRAVRQALAVKGIIAFYIT
ncbi:MAG: hypothetical protein ACYDAB_15360 [bacterium]